VSRIISTFPAAAQPGMRAKLAQNVRGVVSQRLLPRKNGAGRIVACEVLTMSALARELILDPLKSKDLGDLIRKGTMAEGMMSFDTAIFHLYKQGHIDEATALQHATSPTDLKLKLDGFA
jgi:twitching motility protein PilT